LEQVLASAANAQCRDIELTGDGVTLASGNTIRAVCGPNTFTADAMTQMLAASAAGDDDEASRQFLLGSGLNVTKVEALVADVDGSCAKFANAETCAASEGVDDTIQLIVGDGTGLQAIPAPPPPAAGPTSAAAHVALPAIVLLLAALAWL